MCFQEEAAKSVLAEFNLGCDVDHTQHVYRVYVTTFLGFGGNMARQRYEDQLLNVTLTKNRWMCAHTLSLSLFTTVTHNPRPSFSVSSSSMWLKHVPLCPGFWPRRQDSARTNRTWTLVFLWTCRTQSAGTTTPFTSEVRETGHGVSRLYSHSWDFTTGPCLQVVCIRYDWDTELTVL